MTLRLLSIVLAAAACGSASAPPMASAASTTPARTPAMADDPSCPLLVPGTSVTYENTMSGAALVFVTTGDPEGVRARAAALAEMVTKRNGPPSAFGMMFRDGVLAKAGSIEGGARVVFYAVMQPSAGEVEDDVQMHARHLTGGTCKM